MFDKFGEFDSAEEINRAAAAQKAEGDLEALKMLAIENGLDSEDAEDYMKDMLPELCTPTMAAIGKLKVEAENLKLEREFAMLKEELQMNCMSFSWLAVGIRKKGKSLAEYLAKIIDKGYQDAVTPPKAILDKVTAVPSQYRDSMKTGMPDKKDRMEVMEKYYRIEGGEKRDSV